MDLVDFIKSKTTWPVQSEGYAGWPRALILHPPKNCLLQGESLIDAQANVLNHSVVVVADLDPRMRFRGTTWMAPDLGCAELQKRLEERQPDGSYQIVSEEKLVSLRLVEPEPSLFEEGQDYAELKPSAVAGKIAAQLGVSSASGDEQQSGTMIQDRMYEQAWAAR
jgi:hypothetical protein